MKTAPHISLVLFLGIVLLALLGPFISPYSYCAIDLASKNTPPGSLHWFGSDDLGRDLFCRVWHGARISLAIGFCAAFVDGIIGTLLGALAAYRGKWVEELIMRTCDILHMIPTLLIVILLSIFLGSGLQTLLIALFLTGWIGMARIVRAQILQIKESDYITAAISIGASPSRILFRHLIPNAMGPILATAMLTIPSAIFTEAFLSFLGIGLQPPYASLGILIGEGIGAMEFYPWRLLFPSLVITLLMLSLNFIGNALRDTLDPRLRT